MYSFDEIYGNKNIIRNMQNSIVAKKVSHAYILSGQAGIGKKMVANTFVKTLQCIEGKTEPCNRCISCRSYESGNHPDVFHINLQETKSIGVEQIREQVNVPMGTKPHGYPYKIFIIECGELMTVQAQNAILKTIEEPAPYGVFIILTTSVGLLLPTIISRCVIFKMKPLDNVFAERFFVERAGLSLEEASAYAAYCQGNVGRGISLIKDEGFIKMREWLLNTAQNVINFSEFEALNRAKEMDNYKDNILEALDILYLWYRDLVVFKETGMKSFVVQKDKLVTLEETAYSVGLRLLFNSLDAIELAKQQLKYYGNFQLVMENMFLKLTGHIKSGIEAV